MAEDFFIGAAAHLFITGPLSIGEGFLTLNA
jgi:hypothetical protein